MKPITLQDIFNAAWQAFIVEDKPPANTGDGCEYLTADGRRCAVGLVLPEDVARAAHSSFQPLHRRHPALFADDVRANDARLDEFQAALHDALCDPYQAGVWAQDRDQREEAYRGVAEEFGLTIPEPAAAVAG